MHLGGVKQILFRMIAAGLISTALTVPSIAADTIKIGFIDPLSGTFANVGEQGEHTLQMLIEDVNARGGANGQKLELIALDSKANAQEALIAFKQLTDQGVRFFFQGNSSAVAGALSDAVAKHNSRSPDNTILFLNYGAVDPALTNDRCNFWHFRFDADADMKMQALTSYMTRQKGIKKVYLNNQDYAFGQAVSKAAHAMLVQKRPDVEIVGDDLHPLGKVKDFGPYIAKTKASGADSVVTGNWGADLALLIKASKESGGPSAIGEAGEGHLKQVSHWHSNVGDAKSDAIVAEYKKRFPDAKDDFYWLDLKNAMDMLVKAINDTKSTDPQKVALALEGMKYQAFRGEVTMRADNHQILQPMFVSGFAKVGTPGVKHDVERTGYGFRTEGRLEAADTMTLTTCKMQRP
jgi:branched-chain amino acid transport system substrate-binding protein